MGTIKSNIKLLKVIAFIGVFIMTSNSLTSCNSYNLTGIPRVDIENHLGNSMIGNILTEANVVTGASIYDGSRAFSHIQKEDTKLYQVISSEIERAKQSNQSIAKVLNEGNLGVTCINNLCQYHGYFIKNFSNLPKNKTPTGSHINRGDVDITFNPNNLTQTYNISIIEQPL